jgi:DNA-binding HxlR family transcriptional regulator
MISGQALSRQPDGRTGSTTHRKKCDGHILRGYDQLMATARPNVLDPASGSRRVIELLSDSWSVLVIYALSDQRLRYREIEGRVGGISQRMLTQTLRTLLRHGLVETADDGDGYRLTHLGRSLLDEVLDPLCRWAQAHHNDLQPAPVRHMSGGGCLRPSS